MKKIQKNYLIFFKIKAAFSDPVNTKMIKETLTLFLAHQQQTLENEDSVSCNNNNESLGQTQNEQQSEIVVKSEEERELHAVQIVQVFY